MGVRVLYIDKQERDVVFELTLYLYQTNTFGNRKKKKRIRGKGQSKCAEKINLCHKLGHPLHEYKSFSTSK